MVETTNFVLADMFDPSSDFYRESWPEVVTTALEILRNHGGLIFENRGPKIVRCMAPPFDLLLNLSLREMQFQDEHYAAGELAFRRDGRKVAWLNFFLGPSAQFTVRIEGAAAMTEKSRLAKARCLERSVVKALKAEASRLPRPN
jgi:hypothetical protein